MARSNHRFKTPSEATHTPIGDDRMPTNAELLYELRKHGAKPPPPVAVRTTSRRTRDFLLLAGLGSVAILVVSFRVLSASDTATVLRLAFTGIALLVGLLWFVFYGVMSRY
ncbi:MAG: hypothetical protein HZA93_27575 [Verrucomicrobia bacterium]|nr:hypothetical protein [Verrucomicrobiota bacterium]